MYKAVVAAVLGVLVVTGTFGAVVGHQASELRSLRGELTAQGGDIESVRAGAQQPSASISQDIATQARLVTQLQRAVLDDAVSQARLEARVRTMENQIRQSATPLDESAALRFQIEQLKAEDRSDQSKIDDLSARLSKVCRYLTDGPVGLGTFYC